jgi:hypothetical protein
MVLVTRKTVAEATATMATAERRRAAARRRIDDLPNNLDLQLISACIGASRRIHLEREVACECPVLRAGPHAKSANATSA